MRDILFSHTLGRGSAEVSPFPSRRAGPAWPGGAFSIVTCSWEAPGPQSRRDFRPDPTRLLPAGWRSGCRRKGPQVGGFILSQVPLIKVSAGPRPPPPPGGPRGGTFWPLPAPGGFRRPTRTKSRAQLQDLESPGRVTAVSVCLHLYVASLPPGSDVRLGPLFEGPCDIRPLDNPGSPSHLSVLRYTCKHPASA